MFNFRQETFDKGTILYSEKEKSNRMFVVKNGIVEITVKIEGFNLAVERLYRGSVFNHKSFLLSDLTSTTAECTQSMTLFYLTSD